MIFFKAFINSSIRLAISSNLPRFSHLRLSNINYIFNQICHMRLVFPALSNLLATSINSEFYFFRWKVAIFSEALAVEHLVVGLVGSPGLELVVIHLAGYWSQLDLVVCLCYRLNFWQILTDHLTCANAVWICVRRVIRFRSTPLWRIPRKVQFILANLSNVVKNACTGMLVDIPRLGFHVFGLIRALNTVWTTGNLPLLRLVLACFYNKTVVVDVDVWGSIDI